MGIHAGLGAGTTDVTSERDFYWRLLELGGQDAVEPLLEHALALIVEVTGASKAYIELFDEERSEPGFWRGHGCTAEDVGAIRTSIPRGIIAHAIGEGRTIETASAVGDERFRDLGSVRQHDIQEVLCAPVGTNPPLGVVYLQGRTRVGPFTAPDRHRAELFARQLAPLVDRLVRRRPASDHADHTREVRQRFRCPGLVGRSRALAVVLHQASLVAPLDVDVLITGPSGTGKSALAQAISANSPRSNGAFVAVNCAALPDNLIESELFGAERGAHSTATRKMVGKVAAAEGGTLFLDEIAELSAGAQAKLLHLLQAREYHPLGASQPLKANVRIIAATNADLLRGVSARTFREDLYYRLHILPLAMPGLDERAEDIPELVHHLVAEAMRKHRFPALGVARGTVLACGDASWPGHVRQLANAMEAAVIRAQGERAKTVEAWHVFPNAPRQATADPETFQDATRRFQRRYVAEMLERNEWNVSETARQLGLARSHVYNLIHELGLRRHES